MILIVYDRLSKIAHSVAITEETLAESLVRLFRNNVWKLHGLPENVIDFRQETSVCSRVNQKAKQNVEN